MVDQMLNELSEEERTFIELKYFQRQSMSEIEKTLPYSARKLYRLQKGALDRLKNNPS